MQQLALSAIAASQGWRPLRQGPIDIWGPNGFFVLLFLSAAALFIAHESGINLVQHIRYAAGPGDQKQLWSLQQARRIGEESAWPEQKIRNRR